MRRKSISETVASLQRQLAAGDESVRPYLADALADTGRYDEEKVVRFNADGIGRRIGEALAQSDIMIGRLYGTYSGFAPTNLDGLAPELQEDPYLMQVVERSAEEEYERIIQDEQVRFNDWTTRGVEIAGNRGQPINLVESHLENDDERYVHRLFRNGNPPSILADRLIESTGAFFGRFATASEARKAASRREGRWVISKMFEVGDVVEVNEGLDYVHGNWVRARVRAVDFEPDSHRMYLVQPDDGLSYWIGDLQIRSPIGNLGRGDDLDEWFQVMCEELAGLCGYDEQGEALYPYGVLVGNRPDEIMRWRFMHGDSPEQYARHLYDMEDQR